MSKDEVRLIINTVGCRACNAKKGEFCRRYAQMPGSILGTYYDYRNFVHASRRMDGAAIRKDLDSLKGS